MHRLFLVLSVFFSSVACAQVAAPSTPAGNVFSRWLQSFNSGDPEQIVAFTKTYHPRSEIPIKSILQLRQRTGGFTLMQVEESGPHRLTAIVEEKDSGSVARLSLDVSDEQQHKVLAWTLKPVDLQSEFRPVRVSESEAIINLEERTNELAKADKFSGQLLIARHGKILLDKSWGRADRETGRPVTSATQFRIGSMNKMFTTVAVLQLVEAGKLSLDDLLIKFIPEYPNRDLASKISIRHLLTHKGGTGDIFGEEFDRYRLQLRDHDAYVKKFGPRASLDEPGARFRYSNYGFILLGAIIERVSEMSYYAYVEKHIYQPAGMTSTNALPEEVNVPGRAVGYMRRNGALVTNTGTLPYRGTAAGGGYSTTNDLLLFARALQVGRLISAASLAGATEPQGAGLGTGLGFMHDGHGASRMYGHNGGAPGMNGALWIYPNAGYVVIGLTNMDPESATRPMLYFTRRMPLN